MTAIVLALSISQVSTDAGAAGSPTPSVHSRAQAQQPHGRATAPVKCPHAHRGLRFYSRRFNEWRAKMGAERHERVPLVEKTTCPRYLANLMRAKSRAARLAFERWFERTYEKWRCIHEHEGAWTDDDPPYWGGLQMTYWFQRTYGREFLERYGTADRWPVWAQLLTAERAWRGDGGSYRQWGTAGRCGLS